MAKSHLLRRLTAPVDLTRDHFIGNPDAEITLVEYGSYSCKYCHAAHEVIANLRDRFGDRMRYVFRQLPIREAIPPAGGRTGVCGGNRQQLWQVHDELMHRGRISQKVNSLRSLQIWPAA